jgi:hypothetical protein
MSCVCIASTFSLTFVNLQGSVDLDHETLARKFAEVCKSDTEQQTELFLKSFIMVLGDDWKVLLRLQKVDTKRY